MKPAPTAQIIIRITMSVIVLLISSTILFSQDTWVQKADLGGMEREYAVGFSIGNKGYIGTGLVSGSFRKQDFWQYDPSTDAWSQMADFGGLPRHSAVGFSIGTKGYIGTGSAVQGEFVGTRTKDFWEYDPATNTWAQKANFGGSVRYKATGFSIGSKGYIGTGNGGGVIPQEKDFWEYNPVTDTWVQKSDFGGSARESSVGFSIDNKGYIGTGDVRGGFVKDFWEYDPITNTWLQKSDFGGTARHSAVGFSINDRGYIGTGVDASIFIRDFWEYDPSGNIWIQRAEFPGTRRAWAVGFSINSKGYLGTGHVGNPSKDFWEYTPCITTSIFYRDADNDTYGDPNITIQACSVPAGYANNNTDCNDANNAIHPGAAEICNGLDDDCDGSVDEDVQNTFYQDADGDGYGNATVSILACTVPSGYVSNSTDCNDANNAIHPGATETCNGDDDDCDGSVDNGVQETRVQKADFGGSARYLAVGFSIGSKGYVGTGLDAVIGIVNDFWEYDPSTNTWSQKADFGGSARQGAIGFSIGAKGYIGTGFDGGYNKDFWEYDPSTNTWLQKADFGGEARYRAVGFSIGNKGYIGTGTDNSGEGDKKDFWEYDPVTNIWMQKADFGGTARTGAVGFSIGTKGYIGTGFDPGYKKDFWEYDPFTNMWSQKADFGGTARHDAIGFSLGSKGFIGTGNDGVSKKDFWEYDPSANIWLQKADFGGTVRRLAVGFSIGTKGYIGTGLGAGLDEIYKKDFWEYTQGLTNPTFYRDADNDTYGDPNNNIQACNAPPGYVSNNTDCNDANNAIHPGAIEICNGVDDNCDGSIDEGVQNTFYQDTDGDGFGNAVVSIFACTAPAGYVSNSTDCDDANSAVHPGATETCNGIDDNCDGLIDEGAQNTFYRDTDGDGYGNAAITILECTAPAGYVSNNTDCNDANSAIHPGATEICNGVDDNCDGLIDEGVQITFYQDADADGYGNVAVSILECTAPAGYVNNSTDCNDANNAINPGVTEVCNGIDDDCDGLVDEAVPETWIQKADFAGIKRDWAVAFSIGNKGYIGTGYDENATSKKDFWEYDPVTNTWMQKADFGGIERSRAVGFSIGTKGYIGTGIGPTGLLKDFWEYDPATNTWMQKTDFGGSARNLATGFSIDTKGYLGTGSESEAYRKDFWQYDPSTDSWVQLTDFGGTPRSRAVGFSIGMKGYIGTGEDVGKVKDFWEYDPSTDSWLQKADFGGTPRDFAVGFSIGNRGYIGTGEDANYKKDFWEYNPSTNTWNQKADFGGNARSSAVGFSIGSKGYIGIGSNESYSSDFWEYTPGVANPTFYRDADNDTYGDPNNTIQACNAPPGYVSNNTDCNDGNNAIHPGATEVCNGIDDDCDGSIDEGVQTTFYQDVDGDGYGNVAVSMLACTTPSGYVSNSTDCNDANNAIHLGATEICNGVDDNCDGLIDEGVQTTFYQDADGDGYGIATVSILACTAPVGYVNNSTDCNDANNAINPGVTEVCNGIDDNCNGSIDESGQYTWMQKANFGGTGRAFAVGFSIGTKGYIGTGYHAFDGGYKKDFWEYDPSTNTWSQKADFGGTNRWAAVGFSIDSKGYIGTGNDGIGVKKDFWEYDPSTNTWTQKADVGGTARYYAVGFHIGSKGYIGAGNDGTNKKDFWEYDPSTDSWLQKADFAGNGTLGAVGFSIGAKGYIGTGDGDNGKTKDFWEYDPSINIWLQKADFGGTARYGSVGFSFGPYGYIGTGEGNGLKKDFWEFSPATNTWVQKADFGGTARYFATAFSIGSKGYMGTGFDVSGYIKDFWEYTPDVITTTFYRDADNDTFGDPNNTAQACNAPPGYVSNSTDCNDANGTIHPGAIEICNGIDDNCNGTIDEGGQIIFYQDADGDGYGNSTVTILACSAPAGYVSNNTDCNDASNTVYPGATEICGNNIDDDCDGLTDEGCVTGNWYRSRQSGNWNNIATWEVSANGGQSWANATVTPTSADGYITVRNAHTVTITAAVTIDDVTVDAGGILTQRSNTTVNNGQGNDIIINGTYNLENSGNVLGAGTVLINDVFNLIAGDIYVPFELAPAANLNMNTGGAKTLRSLLTNNGMINWSAGNLTLHSGTLINNGVFNITNAVVVRLLNGTGTNLLSNSPAGIITKSGASNAFIVVPFNNNGSVQLNSGTLRIQGIYNNYNAVSFFAGAVLESFNQGVINFETGTSLSGAGTIYNNQSLNVNTAIDLPASVSFDCFGDLGGTGELTVNGAFNWDNGDISCAVTIAAAGTLTITPGAKSLNAVLTNNGTVNWINGNISFQNGTLDNYGSFNISNDNNLVNAAGINLFTNNASGSVSKSSGGANSVAVPFINEGLIEGLGTITFSNITNNGVVAPGLSPGIITMNSVNNLFTANSELQIEINSGSGAGSGHDQLRRAGNLALDGTLSVAETGTVPDGSYEIIRLTSGTISGSFSSLELPAGYSLRIQNNNRVWLDKVSPLSAMPGNRLITAQPERSNNKPGGKISSPVLFPNPANQQVNILLPDELANGKISIQIIDQTGKMIKQWQAEQFNNKGRIISLNTAAMHNGLYIVVIKDNKGGQVNKKVIIQH